MQSPVVYVASVVSICVWNGVVYAVSSGLCGLSGFDLCGWCQYPVLSVVSAVST